MSIPEEVYVVLNNNGMPVIAHTTLQGAAESEARMTQMPGSRLGVFSVRLVVDD